jgi:hypothetical protein
MPPMGSYNTSSGTQTGNTYLYGYVLPTNPALTVASLSVPNNAVMHILAVDVVNQPEQVNLGDATDDASPAFNTVGISVNARTQVTGGASTYSANALGNTVAWNGQTFDIGPATVSVDDAVAAAGYPPVTLPEGEYTSVQFLGSSVGPNPNASTFTICYANGTSESYNLAVSSWSQGYNGASTTAPWESIAASMGSYNTSSGNQSGEETYLYGYVLPTNPSETVTALAVPNFISIHILAIDVVDQPPPVNLGSISDNDTPPPNTTAITANSGATWGGSGIDGSGDVYSANALGGSSLTWNSQTFNFGAAAAPDAIAAEGQTIALTHGYYTSLQLLGTATGGTAQSVTFTVNYVGGATATFNQTFSDWMDGYSGGGTTAPGESIVSTMHSYNNSSGTQTGTVYLYGYVIPLNPTQMIASIVFPNNSKVKVLSIDEVDQPPQVNLGDGAGDTSPANVSALTFNSGASWDGTGLDGSGDTYSLNALASATGSDTTITWNSQVFNLGPAYTGDAIGGSSSLTFPLPEGYYTSIQVLGTATGGSAVSGTLTVNYVTGAPYSTTVSFSDWKAGTTTPGESIVASMTSYNTPSGNTSGNAYLYGFVLPVNPAQIVSSITLPSSSSIKIFAIDVVFQPPQATLVKQDYSTEGNWIGVYGGQGYNVINSSASYPFYAVVTPAGESSTTWSTSPSGESALQTPGGGGRIAAAWYSTTSFTIGVNLTDGQAHDLALYFLDYNGSNERSEQVQITDVTTGSVLFTQTVSDFYSGIYLQWVITGNVQITITDLAGSNAVLSGLFFDTPSASATFVKQDTTTEGNWIGAYGSQGYNVISSTVSYPSYATVTPTGQTSYTWASNTTNEPALEIPGGGTSRIAACWYGATSFTVDVDITDGKAHDLALYFLDYQGGNGRAETVQLTNAATGALLGTETVSSFSNGVYLQWEITGNVLITFTKTAGANAVLSGLFFDPPTTMSPLVVVAGPKSGTGGGGTVGLQPVSSRKTETVRAAAAVVSVAPAAQASLTPQTRQTAFAPALTNARAVDALLEQDELITLSLAVTGDRQSRVARIGLPVLS